ncbi:MAG TPA: hypothetical protein VFX12_13220 [Vicinamibacterales bacterium]|nr:hypothetical protein [Vicinamibacterales bacterium]
MLCLCVAALASCRAGQPRPYRIAGRFGPIVGNELVTGRAVSPHDGPVLLLTGGRALISIDIPARRATRHPIDAEPAGGETMWGLARLAGGSLWTLNGRHQLLELREDGSAGRAIPLRDPHVALYGEGNRLLYDRLDFEPPAAALTIGRPGEEPGTVWGTMRTRALPLARASVAALNLVSCGVGLAGERPCWFPDETAITLTTSGGVSRRLELAGLQRVAAEVLLTSDNPPRPIRDVYVEPGGTIWVLSSGTADPGRRDWPGGWLLAQYSAGGRLVRTGRLPDSGRLILRADAAGCVLLSGRGEVIEVRS